MLMLIHRAPILEVRVGTCLQQDLADEDMRLARSNVKRGPEQGKRSAITYIASDVAWVECKRVAADGDIRLTACRNPLASQTCPLGAKI